MDELEDAREDAIRQLCAAHARDALRLAAFEDRFLRLKDAPNRATIDAIVADLPDASPYPLTASNQTVSLHTVSADHTHAAMPVPFEPAESLRIGSILASTSRAGTWTVPLHLDLKVLLGELTIDLRDATFGSDVLDIDVDTIFGSLTLIVPAGAQVENEVEEMMGSSTHSTRSSRGASPIGLLIRLQGRVLLGSLEVKEKPPSDAARRSWWQRFLPPGS